MSNEILEKSEVARFLNPRQLELILLPTENCNFRCTYCYEDFEIGRMQENTIAAVKKLITNRLPQLDSLVLNWFGGEPLIAKDIVTDLTQFAQAAAKEKGVRFKGVMTTNAFALDRDTFKSMIDMDVRQYQISIDGDEEEHNKTRKLISGKGSFNRIWANLLAMRENPEKFVITLRIHLHTENIDSLRGLLPKLHEAFGHDPRFSLFFKPVGNWGGDSVKSMSLLKSENEIIAEFNDILEQLGWFAARRPTAIAADNKNEDAKPAKKPIVLCYAAQPNSFIIRADGALAKCTVAFSDPRNRVGHINDDGTLTIEDKKIHTFMRGFKTLDAKELKCPMNGMPKAETVQVIKFEKKPEAAEQIAALA